LYCSIFFLLKHCGIRTAGELLFCQQQQKSNQKNAATSAAPLQKTQGCPLKNDGCHAAPELAKNAQTCWGRRPMKTIVFQWLAEVGVGQEIKKAKN